MDIIKNTKYLYKKFGQSKPMVGEESCFFLQRNFKGEQDLLIIFNTLPCQMHCKYCNLSNRKRNEASNIIEQFAYAIEELKHSLSVLDRVTLSNNGSILDLKVIAFTDLINILQAITQIKNVSTVVLETDLKFVNDTIIEQLNKILGEVKINILTGFETLNEEILTNILGKKRRLKEFEERLDLIAKYGCDFTAYILYKPVPWMSEDEAYKEAKDSAIYLIEECQKRKIRLSLRVNPMFAACGTEWAMLAKQTSSYIPPKITNVFQLAHELDEYVPTYLGLSTENKSENWGSYRANSDFTHQLLLDIIHFNQGRYF